MSPKSNVENVSIFSKDRYYAEEKQLNAYLLQRKLLKERRYLLCYVRAKHFCVLSAAEI